LASLFTQVIIRQLGIKQFLVISAQAAQDISMQPPAIQRTNTTHRINEANDSTDAAVIRAGP
jgi:hypothetical protein